MWKFVCNNRYSIIQDTVTIVFQIIYKKKKTFFFCSFLDVARMYYEYLLDAFLPYIGIYEIKSF